jgi:hypothetical protein
MDTKDAMMLLDTPASTSVNVAADDTFINSPRRIIYQAFIPPQQAAKVEDALKFGILGAAGIAYVKYTPTNHGYQRCHDAA